MQITEVEPFDSGNVLRHTDQRPIKVIYNDNNKIWKVWLSRGPIYSFEQSRVVAAGISKGSQAVHECKSKISEVSS